MATKFEHDNDNVNNLTFGKQVRHLGFCDFGNGWEAVGTYDEPMIKELYVQLKQKFKGE